MEKQKNNYNSFLMPEMIYLPFDSPEKLTLRKNGYVYKGELLGKKTGDENIYSSVSGKIRGTVRITSNDKEETCLAIENDYKDKSLKLIGGKRKIEYKRKDANEILDRFNLSRKYNGKKYLVIDFLISSNDVENRYLSEKYSFEILECIDLILSIFNLEKAFLVINDKYTEMYLKRYSRMYPNIDYLRKLDVTESCVCYSANEILEIYYAFKYDKSLSEKFITIVNGKSVMIIKTKVNILTSELLSRFNLNFTNVKALNCNRKIIDNYKNSLITKNIKSIILN